MGVACDSAEDALDTGVPGEGLEEMRDACIELIYALENPENIRGTPLEVMQVQSVSLSLIFSYNLYLTGDLPSLVTCCNHSYCPFSSIIFYYLLL